MEIGIITNILVFLTLLSQIAIICLILIGAITWNKNPFSFIQKNFLFFGIALFKKYRSILNYVLPLSVIGFFVAGLHYLLPISKTILVDRQIVGYSTAHSKKFQFYLGIIPIPMMALTAFTLLNFFQFIKLKGGNLQ